MPWPGSSALAGPLPGNAGSETAELGGRLLPGWQPRREAAPLRAPAARPRGALPARAPLRFPGRSALPLPAQGASPLARRAQAGECSASPWQAGFLLRSEAPPPQEPRGGGGSRSRSQPVLQLPGPAGKAAPCWAPPSAGRAGGGRSLAVEQRVPGRGEASSHTRSCIRSSNQLCAGLLADLRQSVTYEELCPLRPSIDVLEGEYFFLCFPGSIRENLCSKPYTVTWLKESEGKVNSIQETHRLVLNERFLEFWPTELSDLGNYIYRV
ncbi:hypothetical protein KIL84_019109, partial [Mauremys mutica]